MDSAKLRYGLLLVTAIVLCAIALPLAAGHKAGESDEVIVALSDVPAAVAATLKNEAGSGTIGKIEMEKKDGVTQYAADITRDGKEYEVKVAADGKLIGSEADEENESEANEEKNGEENEVGEAKEADEGDEVIVELKDVPAAVAATLKNEAGSGTIGKIEMEDEDGVTQYSADITRDGKEYEVKVAADGKLIGSEADEEKEEHCTGEKEDSE